MYSLDRYRLALSGTPDLELATRIYDLVWRMDFPAPGFCVLDLDTADSHTQRSNMVLLKELLSEVSVRRNRLPFRFRSLGRFDQQETTRFHLDGAPASSLLMLGYEPSNVRSRIFLADYSRAAFEKGMTPRQYLNDFNPMFHDNETMLKNYITELPQPAMRSAWILLINNSSLPFAESRTNPLGVLHKAEILNPTNAERRIVNSAMLVFESEEISRMKQEEFIDTEAISTKDY